MWIAALAFTGILILFMIATFFLTPQFTPDQRRTVLILYPLLAGFSTFFLGGSALFEFTTEIATGAKLGFSATAGIAVFALCYLYPPYFFRIPHLQEAMAETRTILLQDPNRIGGDEATRRRALAERLYKNCTQWSQVLLEVFDEAGKLWLRDGATAARDTILKQQEDINKLDYWSLQGVSAILKFLRGDQRFARFADACSTFYQSALDVKNRAYGSIGQQRDKEILDEVNRWKSEVEDILRPVADEFHRLTTVVG